MTLMEQKPTTKNNGKITPDGSNGLPDFSILGKKSHGQMQMSTSGFKDKLFVVNNLIIGFLLLLILITSKIPISEKFNQLRLWLMFVTSPAIILIYNFYSRPSKQESTDFLAQIIRAGLTMYFVLIAIAVIILLITKPGEIILGFGLFAVLFIFYPILIYVAGCFIANALGQMINNKLR